MKVLSVLAVGVVLAHLSPLATGILLCLDGEAGSDCCPEPLASQYHIDGARQLQDRSDCNCCVTFDAARSTASAASPKASLVALFGSGLPRDAVSPAGTRIASMDGDDPGDPGLSSLRAVVLLI